MNRCDIRPANYKSAGIRLIVIVSFNNKTGVYCIDNNLLVDTAFEHSLNCMGTEDKTRYFHANLNGHY